MNKQEWLDIAEILDAMRVVPRVLMALAWTLFSIYIWWTTGWYFGLETPSAWDMGFISSTISALGAALASLTNRYFDSGRKWNQ